MADFNFTLVSVPRKAGALAERTAVLRPLTGLRDLTRDADVTEAVGRVLARWRGRCNVLRQTGWKGAGEVKFQYMRNCPPAGVYMRPDTRTRFSRACRQTAVCPWCWARDVVKRTYDATIRAMAAADSLYRPGAAGYPYKLVTATTRGTVADDGAQPRAALDRVARLLAQRSKVTGRVTAGVAFLATVAPSGAGWLYSTRLLALVPAAYEPRPDTRVVTHPTRRRVAAAVARFARYPAGLLTGDPAMAVRLLALRPEYRLFRLAGVFHGANRHRRPPAAGGGSEPGRYLDL